MRIDPVQQARIIPTSGGNGASLAAESPLVFHRFSAVQFLIVLASMLIAIPFVETLRSGTALASGLVTAVLLSAVVAIGGHRRMRMIAIALVIPALAGRWLHHFYPHMLSLSISTAATIVFVGFVAVTLLRFVLAAGTVNANVLCAALSAYLMMGLLWGVAYLFVSEVSPDSFAFSGAPVRRASLLAADALYFSFSTLTTLAYGDIVPASRAARVLAISEAVTGVFFMAVLIARLIARYSSRAKEAVTIAR